MRKKQQPNFYLILNVSPKAQSSEIKAAYLELVKTYHPDKNKGLRLAEKKFQQINQAWEVLKDPEKRQIFDAELEALKSRPAPKAAPVKQKEAPIDLELDLKVSLEDICQSGLKKINYLKPVNGAQTKSSFSAQIPWRAREGSRLKFKGRGGAAGKKLFGDLYIRIHLKPHKIFKYAGGGGDLLLEQPVPFVSAVQGAKITVPSPYGLLALNLNPPVKDGQILKVKGQGLPKDSKGGRSDLFVKVLLDYPEKGGLKIQKQMASLPLEKQKIYAEKFKDPDLIYPEVLKFQKKVQEMKNKAKTQ